MHDFDFWKYYDFLFKYRSYKQKFLANQSIENDRCKFSSKFSYYYKNWYKTKTTHQKIKKYRYTQRFFPNTYAETPFSFVHEKRLQIVTEEADDWRLPEVVDFVKRAAGRFRRSDGQNIIMNHSKMYTDFLYMKCFQKYNPVINNAGDIVRIEWLTKIP